MENHVTVKQRVDNLPDKTIALLALQQQHTVNDADATTCPTDQTFSDFIQGKLEGQAREQMLAHLDQCSDCYQHWMDELQKNQKARKVQSTTPIPTADWWGKLAEVLHFNHPWQASTYFATLVIFVVLIQIRSESTHEPAIPEVAENNGSTLDMIDESSESILAMQYAAAPKNLVVNKLPSQAHLFGFTPSDKSPIRKAYESCLNNGFETLAGKKTLTTPLNAEYKAFCQLGQRNALLYVAAENLEQFTQVQFWQQQLKVAHQFEQDFSTAPSVIKKHSASVTELIDSIVGDVSILSDESLQQDIQNRLTRLDGSL